MKKLFVIISSFLLAVNLLAFTPAPVFANACDNLDQAFNQYGGKPNFPRYCSVGDALQKILNLAFGMVATATIVFIMIGGYKYMISGANADQAKKGKQTVFYALAGLVVVIVAATIVNLVINAIT